MIQRSQLLAWSLVMILTSATHSYGVSNQYIENFTSTEYRDSALTTAWWDTTSGTVGLFPFSPSVVGTTPTAANAHSVFVAGQYAYVADGISGLKIIDISDATTPAIVGSYNTSGDAQGIHVSGTIAYVADGSAGLRIVDVTDRTNPTSTGIYNTPGSALDVTVCGRFAYVADLASGILIIDVTNPSSPSLVGSYDTPAVARGIDLSGRLAFVADDSGGLQIINVENPALPTLVGTYTGAARVRDVSILGANAYLAVYTDGLHVVDISDPSSPVFVGSRNTPLLAERLVADGNEVYLVDTISDLEIIDVSDPANPTLLSTQSLTATAQNVDVWGKYVYVVDDGPGLNIIDVSASAPPFQAGGLASPDSSLDVRVDGDLSFVALGNTGLDIIDISDPSAPALTTNWTTGGPITDLFPAGDRLYVLMGEVQSVDISDPVNPSVVAIYPCNAPEDIFICGDLGYVVTQDGIEIFEAHPTTSPDTLQSVGALTRTDLTEIFVDGRYAFVGGASGLEVIDVGDPANPTLVTALGTTPPRELIVTGNLLFSTTYIDLVVTAQSAVTIFDVSDPTTLSFLGVYAQLGEASTIAEFFDATVSGDAVFVAAEDGVQIIDISNPAIPALDTIFESASAGRHVDLSGDYVYSPTVTEFQSIVVAGRTFFADLNTARSTPITIGGPSIVRARLAATQVDSIRWRISADDSSWTDIVPDGNWLRLDSGAIGGDLRWRSNHIVNVAAVNPTASSLQLEWRTESGTTAAIEDVPNDQGGWVRLRFLRSGYDFAGEGATAILQYFVQRRFDDAPAIAAMRSQGLDVPPSAQTSWLSDWPGEIPLVEWRGRYFVLESDRAKTAVAWEIVASAPGLRQDENIVLVPTLEDSMAVFSPTVYRVLAQSVPPSAFFYSDPDSGYSLDNIAPGVPQNLAVSYNTGAGNQLTWDPSEAQDFQYFKVYRSDDPDFTPMPADLVHETISMSWTDPDFDGWNVYYKITAIDYVGNEGDPASAGTATAIDDVATPEIAALYQNVPNPFNPTTTIRYDVPASAEYVSLHIYDVGGRRVRTLVDGALPAGRRTATWDGNNNMGELVTSGVYFYKLVIGGYTNTKKLILLK